MFNELNEPRSDKLSSQEEGYKRFWVWSWKCKCGAKGRSRMSRNRVSNAINRHLKDSPKCKIEDCKPVEVE